jgi:hypothetical protein
MRWFLSIAVVMCVVVVGLTQALPGTSSRTRGGDYFRAASPVCLDEPDWFAAIHRYYDCNPAITPDFDFASLYSGVPRGASDRRRSR